MAKKAYYFRNWKDYNKSLIQRGSLTFWFSEEVIDNWKTDQKVITTTIKNIRTCLFYARLR